MRVNARTIAVGVTALTALTGLFYGSFLLIARQAAAASQSPQQLLPGAFGMGATVLIVAMVAAEQMARARLRPLRQRLRRPPDAPGSAPPRESVDVFQSLALELDRTVHAWENSQAALRQTMEGEVTDLRRRVAELSAQRTDLEAAVTETREVHRGAEGQATLFGKIFEVCPVGVAVLTSREGFFSEANQRFLDLVGFDRAELIDHSDTELNIWEQARAREHFLRELTDRSALNDVECQLRNKAGQLRRVLLSLTPVEVQETPCLILTAQDPEEKARLELELVQRQKMEAVGQLAAGLAHDFNNILMIVQGYTSLLLTDPNLDKQSGEALRHVSVAADRAAHLTRQLLAFSRKQIMHARNLDLQEMIGGMAGVLQQHFGSEVSVKLELSTQTPPVEADPSMLQEVIMNLAMNARDAMPQGGQFTVSSTRVEIDRAYTLQRPDARVGLHACLIVTDTGCGMDPAVLGRIFEPFFTTKEVGKGTGLGLATVYGIVKQHNGWIEVASQPSKGTTFKIFLPSNASHTDAAGSCTPASPKASLAGRERILVVEDEPGLRALVPGILKRYGYSVLTATNGQEAIKLWHDNRGQIDLLLTDMVMPEGMSGRELAEHLKADRPELKVIYTSGYSVDVLSDTLGEFVEGVNFLQKPYRPQRLAETVRKCLGTAPAHQEPVTLNAQR